MKITEIKTFVIFFLVFVQKISCISKKPAWNFTSKQAEIC